MTGVAEFAVVGAGSAGIAAARTLRAAGRDVLVLEADDHVGGRCVTDRTTFGYAFDRGGAWLHAASVNPLAPYAVEMDMRVVEDRRRAIADAIIAGRRLEPAELAAYTEAYRNTISLHLSQRTARPDPPLAALLPAGPWRDYAAYVIALLTSVDATRCSSIDYSRFDDAPGEWLLQDGLGTLLARLAAGLPIECGTTVEAIDWSKRAVRVETNRGSVRANAVIVTVSTALLLGGAIRFKPAVPAAVQDALAGLPLGLLNKVAMEVRPGSPLAQSDTSLVYQPSHDVGIMMRPGYANAPMMIAFVGGDCADRLEAEGRGATTQLCREALVSMFGSTILDDVRGEAETAWRAHRWSLGAYSAALPGHADARAVLAMPFADKVWLAGEATHPRLYATVGGAWASGARAAGRAMAAVDGGG
jgi:monoamine oxidase